MSEKIKPLNIARGFCDDRSPDATGAAGGWRRVWCPVSLVPVMRVLNTPAPARRPPPEPTAGRAVDRVSNPSDRVRTTVLHGAREHAVARRVKGSGALHVLRTSHRMAYIGPILRELQISQYYSNTILRLARVNPKYALAPCITHSPHGGPMGVHGGPMGVHGGPMGVHGGPHGGPTPFL